MATHLDLQEQEQIDQLKEFWNQYGNLVTWVVILALGAFAAWNGWNWWQREQAAKASVLFHELDAAQQTNDVNKAAQVMADMTGRYGRTVYALQAALLGAKIQADNGQFDAARSSLQWVLDHSSDASYQSIARLRIAAILIEQMKLDDALKVLQAPMKPEFQALADDRRGDILQLQNKTQEAVAAYQSAWGATDDKTDYRKVIEAKLMALGAAPAASAPSSISTEKHAS